MERKNDIVYSKLAKMSLGEIVAFDLKKKRDNKTTIISGLGAQMYHGYPGIMQQLDIKQCRPNCMYCALTVSGQDLKGNLKNQVVCEIPK